MTSLRRGAVAASAALIGLSAPLTAVSGLAGAAVTAPVGGGTAIVVDGKATCTMTAVGRDRSGRLVGLTAGHCGKVGAWVGAERHSRAGVIGQVALTSTRSDVAVIALYPERVRPTRTVGRATVTGIGTFPGPGTTVCKQGRTTGFTCGPVLYGAGNRSSSYVCGNSGDSGAPILQGRRLVAMLNGRQKIPGTDVAVHCYNPNVPIFTPTVATSITSVLAELNRRGGTGAGFRLI
ncbi:peptidase S1 [Gordonia sp. VNK21]|uniref:peptidase S1 n=1 Tax=Gordonia sp. VNK21 TaxID=3382483 RepID=UPI0038D4B6F3